MVDTITGILMDKQRRMAQHKAHVKKLSIHALHRYLPSLIIKQSAPQKSYQVVSITNCTGQQTRKQNTNFSYILMYAHRYHKNVCVLQNY